jgi:hypothetical protein
MLTDTEYKPPSPLRRHDLVLDLPLTAAENSAVRAVR